MLSTRWNERKGVSRTLQWTTSETLIQGKCGDLGMGSVIGSQQRRNPTHTTREQQIAWQDTKTGRHQRRRPLRRVRRIVNRQERHSFRQTFG